MRVYRLQRAVFPVSINGLGEGSRSFKARWHSDPVPIIYTSQTSSLAILELLGHYVKLPLITTPYRLITLDLNFDFSIDEIRESDLGKDWKRNFRLTRSLGNSWFKSCDTCLLKVPSIHTDKEKNILINRSHKDFSKIKIIENEEYYFDDRFA